MERESLGKKKGKRPSLGEVKKKVGAGGEASRVCRSPQCIKSRRDVDAEVEERARASKDGAPPRSLLLSRHTRPLRVYSV
jgi:hypothetical protein